MEGEPTWMVAPYLWAPSLDGDVGIGQLATSFDVGARDLASKVNAAFMGYLRATREAQFLYIESVGMRFRDPDSEPFFNQNVKSQVLLTEIGYGRHYSLKGVGRESLKFQPYIGIRYAELEAEIRSPQQSLHADENWLDPVLGIITTLPIRNSLALVVKTDAAGFGLGRDRYWNVVGLLQWHWNSRVSFAAGYRMARFDADPGGSNDLQMDLRAEGPMVGVAWNFD